MPRRWPLSNRNGAVAATSMAPPRHCSGARRTACKPCVAVAAARWPDGCPRCRLRHRICFRRWPTMPPAGNCSLHCISTACPRARPGWRLPRRPCSTSVSSPPGSTMCSRLRASCRQPSRRPAWSSRRWSARCCGRLAPSSFRVATRSGLALLQHNRHCCPRRCCASSAWPMRPSGTSANARHSRICCACRTSRCCAATPKTANRLAASALVERAWQARRRLGQPAPDEQRSTLPRRAVTRAPVPRPAPAAAQAVPARLSASAVEALRACPYRFFALNVLGLRESPELEVELEKRDYGTWLHGVLLRFHRDRPETDAASSDLQRLIAAADAEQAALGLDAAAVAAVSRGLRSLCRQLPRLAACPRCRRLALLSAARSRCAASRRCSAASCSMAASIASTIIPPAGMRQLIDYKTGSLQALKRKVATPLEDTQLAFYAALLGERRPAAGDLPGARRSQAAASSRASRRRSQCRRARRRPGARPGTPARRGRRCLRSARASTCDYLRGARPVSA